MREGGGKKGGVKEEEEQGGGFSQLFGGLELRWRFVLPLRRI